MSAHPMAHQHVTEDQLISQLYGLENADVLVHLQMCTACSEQLRAFRQRRVDALDAPPVSTAALARQRGRILERIERPGAGLRWVPAVLAGGLIATVALFPHASRHPAAPDNIVKQDVAKQDITEDQWFREVFSMEGAEEPRAASPIRELFEEREQR